MRKGLFSLWAGLCAVSLLLPAGRAGAQPQDNFMLHELTLEDDEIQIKLPPMDLIVTQRQMQLLADAMAGNDPFLRQRIAANLGSLGKEAAEQKRLGGKMDSVLQGEKEAGAILAQACREEDWQTRQAAVRALAELDRGPWYMSAIPLLSDNKAAVRMEAARAIGKMKLTAAAAQVISLLNDKDVSVRIAAIESLAELNDKQAVKPMLAKFDALVNRPNMQDGEELAEVVYAIGKLKAAAADGRLSKILKMDSPMMRTTATEALGLIGGPEATELVMQALKDAHPSVRAAAIRSLEMIDAKANIPVFMKSLDDPDAMVRMASAQALGRVGYKPALPKLAEVTADELQTTADAAEEAIGQIGGGEAIATAAGMLKGKAANTRMAASRLLVRFHSNRAIVDHVGLLKDEDVRVIAVAAYSLGFIGDRKACPALRQLVQKPPSAPLGEKSRYVSRAVQCAILSLGRLKDEEAIPMLLGHAGNPMGGTATSAIWALGKIGKPTYKGQNVTGALCGILNNMSIYFVPLHPEAAKAIGRLKDPSAVPALQARMGTPSGDEFSLLLAWAIKQCGGTPPEIKLGPRSRRPIFIIQDQASERP